MRLAARILACLALSFSLVGGATAQMPAPVQTDRTQLVFYTLAGEVALSLELATTPAERATGLMNRNGLESSDGMLFVFPEPIETAFWMKDTRIALDMVFIDATYTITRIVYDARPHTLDPKHTRSPIIAAVELPAGQAKARGLKIGDRVRFELPKDRVIL
jgi:hypothetical protein